MTDVDTEIRRLLQRAAELPVEPLDVAALHAVIRRQDRGRQRWQVLGIATVIAVIVAAVAVVVQRGTPTRQGPVSVPTATGGPSTSDLVHGAWSAIPSAPIKVCSPTVVPTGTGAIVLETGLNHWCDAAAALFDATTDSWTEIAPPPPLARSVPVAAWGHGRLVMVSSQSGDVWQWTPAADRWISVPSSLPGADDTSYVRSMTWWHGYLLAADVVEGHLELYDVASTAAVRLSPVRPPARASGDVVDASLAVSHGRLLVAEEVRHNRSDHVEIFRLDTDGRWTLLTASLGRLRGLAGYGTRGGLVPLGSQVLAIGDECPGGCMEDIEEAALVNPGSDASSTKSRRLELRDNFFVAPSLAAGGRSVVALYPHGSASAGLADGAARHRPTISIYDTVARRWRPGPPPPLSAATGALGATVWTSAGLLDLVRQGEPGIGGAQPLRGWLLAPR